MMDFSNVLRDMAISLKNGKYGKGKKLLMSNEENKEKSFMITVMGSIEVFGDETVEQAIAWVEQNITEVQLEITGEEW